jgi:NAD(P)-dependent dehydrogenase (short-subunit alcohol dehydrogenase family)
MQTNFFGAMNVARAALPALWAPRGGAIVNISSLGGQLSFAGFSAYSATKFAVEGVSEAPAQELKPFGVKVLLVEPGQFRTNLAGASLRHMPVIEAYRDIVGGTRQFAHDMHGTQAGDPAMAAAAIEAALDAAETPAAAATRRRRGGRCTGSCPSASRATRDLGAAGARYRLPADQVIRLQLRRKAGRGRR